MLYVSTTLSFASLVMMLGVYYKLSIMTYQHRLMWRDFARRKQINGAADQVNSD